MVAAHSPLGLARRAATVLVGLILCQCSADEPARGHEPAQHRAADGAPIELMTWWAPLGASDPVARVVEVHRGRFPSDDVRDPKSMYVHDMLRSLRARVAEGEPPDVFQAHLGRDHMRWVLQNGRDAGQSYLVPLDDRLPGIADLRRALHPRLLEQVTYGGKLYGIPATVHRINGLYLHREVLATHGLDAPQSHEDLVALGERLAASGIPLFALGGRTPESIGWFVLEGLLPGLHGAAFYRDYFEGRLQPDDPRMIAVLEAALELRPFLHPNWRSMTWRDAADQVRLGKTAVFPAGDWLNVYFEVDRKGAPIVEIAYPGTDDLLVLTGDVFSLPVDARNPEGAERLLDTLASAQLQARLAVEKGSLSPRMDVAAAFDAAGRRHKRALLDRGDWLLSIVANTPADFADPVQRAIVEMLEQNDIEPALMTLRSRYCLLQAEPP